MGYHILPFPIPLQRVIGTASWCYKYGTDFVMPPHTSFKNTGKQVHSENSHVYDTDRCREPHCKPVATMSIKSEQSAKSSTFVGHFRHQPRVMPLHLFLAPARLPLLPLQLRASALSGETQQTKEVRAGSHSLVTVQFFFSFHGVWFWGDSRTHRCTGPSAYKTIITLLHDLQLRIVKRHECGSLVYNKYSTKPWRFVALALDQHKAQQKELLKINNGLHQSANSAPLCANSSWPVDNRIMQSYCRHFFYSRLIFFCCAALKWMDDCDLWEGKIKDTTCSSPSNTDFLSGLQTSISNRLSS